MAILPVALCPLISEALIVDGQLDEDVWILPPAIPFFVRPQVRWIPEVQTQVFTSYDATAFNIAFRCFEDAPERLELSAGPPEPDKLIHDDLVAFRFIPENCDPSMRPLHFVMTAAGKLFQEIEPGRLVEQTQYVCQSQVGEIEWTVEARLPFEAMGVNCPQPNQRWGFAAYRQRVGSRWERSGWLEVGLGPFGETMPGWLLFEDPQMNDRPRGRAVEPYLRRFGEMLDIRIRQVADAEANLPPCDCPVTRHRIGIMIRSLLSIKNDMLHPFHPDALRHYAQILQYNVGRLDELIENLRQGEDPHTSPEGYVFLGSRLEADGGIHAFALIQGRDYESTLPHPLVVLLDGLSDDWVADSRAFLDLAWPQGLDFLLAIPSGLGKNRQFRLAGEDQVFSVIREVRQRFSADPQRTILIGLGQGAEGAFRIAARYPHLFSAVVIGGPVPESTVLDSSTSISFFYWGGPEIGWVGPLRKLDDRARVNIASAPFAGPQALTPKFMMRLTKTTNPPSNEVDLVSPSARYSRGPWAKIDRPVEYSKPARLRLKVTEEGHVEVNSDNVAAFTVFPHEGPFVPGQMVKLGCGGQELVAGSYSHSLHCDLQPRPEEDPPKALMAGPIDEAFHGELLYVYGTQGSDEDGDFSRHAALQAARWPQFDLRIPVKADVEVTEEDLQRAHLHLFGGVANSLLQQMLPSLPVGIESRRFVVGREIFEGDEVLCQFIYPNPLNPRRYVLVHLAHSQAGWLYRGWFPKKEQPEPLPDLWVARLQDNLRIDRRNVPPQYLHKVWFDGYWRLSGG